MCSNFSAPSFNIVFRHIGAEHKFDPNFFVRCGIDECATTYKKFESWRSHINRHHRGKKRAEEDISQIFEVTILSA